MIVCGVWREEGAGGIQIVWVCRGGGRVLGVGV